LDVHEQKCQNDSKSYSKNPLTAFENSAFPALHNNDKIDFLNRLKKLTAASGTQKLNIVFEMLRA
jgi:hypothetical protein